jgi:hypothetical protein
MKRMFIVLCASLFACAAPAYPDQITAQSGSVRAVVQYASAPQSGMIDLQRIRIMRGGNVAYDGALPNGFTQARLDALPGQPLLAVRELDDEGEPEVMLSTFTGGAHCCFGVVIYGYDREAATYRVVAHDFSDTGYSLKQVGGLSYPQFLGADARFAYVFTNFAASAFPIQIWRYSAGDLVEVTSCYPSLITADANQNWTAAVEGAKNDQPVTGVLAAYAADEYMLGDGQQAIKKIMKTGYNDITDDYAERLAAFLSNNGYVGTAGPSCGAPAH